MSNAVLRIATRKSALALWQAEHVAARLREVHRDLSVVLVPMTTRGDELLDRSLASVGGKGLFLKELELAMLEGDADLAVHSLKDVPAHLEPGFRLAAVLARADVSDALVSRRYDSLAALPAGARVGTSSLRRGAQLTAARPDVKTLELRGNVNTRLAKLDAGGYDAIILASAGLNRLGMGGRIRQRLLPPDWLPAPGQAALAIECRSDNESVLDLVETLNDPATHLDCLAERAMNRELGGDCSVPVGAWCQRQADRLVLVGMVGDPATGAMIRASLDEDPEKPERLGQRVAAALLDQGANRFLHP